MTRDLHRCISLIIRLSGQACIIDEYIIQVGRDMCIPGRFLFTSSPLPHYTIPTVELLLFSISEEIVLITAMRFSIVRSTGPVKIISDFHI